MNELLQKITELNNLYKSGLITANEFKDLKKELIGSNNTSSNYNALTQNGVTYFKDYNDTNGRLIKAPEISSLKDTIQIEKAKEFLIGKHINSPNSFTQDELKIFKKHFTPDEISVISSNRQGFNFPLFSVGGVIIGLLPFWLVSISPCLMYFGGITASVYSTISFFVILSQKSSTKSDKIASWIILIEVIAAFVYFGVAWREHF